LDFNGAVHCVDDTPKLDNCAIAGALDDAAMMHGDGRVDQVASERPQSRQNPVLVDTGKPRIADYISYQDRREFPNSAHGARTSPPHRPFAVVPAKRLGASAIARENYRLA
jgi:hypothetical protein